MEADRQRTLSKIAAPVPKTKDSLSAALHPFPYLIPFPEISSLIPEVHLLLQSNMLRLKHRIFSGLFLFSVIIQTAENRF